MLVLLSRRLPHAHPRATPGRLALLLAVPPLLCCTVTCAVSVRLSALNDGNRPTRDSDRPRHVIALYIADKILERGEKLSLLVDRTKDLNEESYVFRCALRHATGAMSFGDRPDSWNRNLLSRTGVFLCGRLQVHLQEAGGGAQAEDVVEEHEDDSADRRAVPHRDLLCRHVPSAPFVCAALRCRSSLPVGTRSVCPFQVLVRRPHLPRLSWLSRINTRVTPHAVACG